MPIRTNDNEEEDKADDEEKDGADDKDEREEKMMRESDIEIRNFLALHVEDEAISHLPITAHADALKLGLEGLGGVEHEDLRRYQMRE